MENRKIKIIILIIILALIFIPIVVWGYSKLFLEIPQREEYQNTIDTSKQTINIYKEEVQKNPSLNSTTNITEEEKREQEEQLKKMEKETKEDMQNVLNIAKKFYPNEMDKILEDAEKEDNEMKNNGPYKAILDAECDLIELVIQIIEEKEITVEEKNDLKEYLDSSKFKLNEVGNTELLEKVENILNN